ncbi:MAG: MgtC/SapB family protein [Candidatus Eremiobacteraeota bacterium]|nr:MgtC/SapB family protein [Candidatus Eremiobacteraeota bacterium]
MISLTNSEIALRLAVAAVLGLAIGLERERVEQPAGLRDHALVSVGSALLMVVSAYGFGRVTHAPDVVLDPSRIAAQVVTGIGFIGAGTIVLRRNVVRGLTTAASIWAAAALGLAAGGGLYFASLVAAVFILIILAGIKSLERRFSRRYRRSVITLIVRRDAVLLEDIRTIAGVVGVALERLDVREDKESPNRDRIDVVFPNVESAKAIALTDAFRRHDGIDALRSSVIVSTRK